MDDSGTWVLALIVIDVVFPEQVMVTGISALGAVTALVNDTVLPDMESGAVLGVKLHEPREALDGTGERVMVWPEP